MMHSHRNGRTHWFAKALFLFAICCPIAIQAQDIDELQQSKSWHPPTIEKVKTRFDQWMTQANIPESAQTQVRDLLEQSADQFRAETSMQTILNALISARVDLRPVREVLEQNPDPAKLPYFQSILGNASEQPFVRDHVRLLYGKWLSQNQYFDESLEQLDQLRPDDVLDPGTLLFYKALAEHQLLHKERCLNTVDQLLENADVLPKRFAVVAKLMSADIEPMETDSMDEIARMMSDIRRRQSLNRAGKRVRGEEEEVIKKLDKVIEQIEAAQQQQQQMAQQQQQQQQQRQQNGQPRNTQSTKPMEDSQAAAGKGDGKVARKNRSEGGKWGDLPAADRAAAMAEMAKDLPPHYRSVIEEYFRKLAEERGQ